MPIEIRHDIEGEPPVGAHLAVLTDDTGHAMALPVGCTMYIIEDPTRADKTFPVVLARVNRRVIEFLCACGNPSCTRKYRFVNNVSGWHKKKPRHEATENR